LKSIHPAVVVALAILLVLPGLIFAGLRFTLPADASNPVVDFREIRSEGLLVQPLSPDPQGLQNGDIVTAMQGRTVNQYLRSMFFSQKSAEPVRQIEYTLLRRGQAISFNTVLKAYSIAQLIQETWSIYFYLIYLELVSILVFALRPRLPAAQLFLVVSNVLLASALVYFPGLKVDDLLYPWSVILYMWGAVVLYGFMLAALVHFSLIFPKRHPLLVQHPGWVLWIYIGVWLPMIFYLAVRWATIISPAGRLALIVQGTTLMSAIYFPLLLLSTLSSYRTGNAQEKRQVRWLLWSLMISLVPYLAFNVVPSLLGMNNQLGNSLLGLLWCTVPTSFAIAVLHERLFDIDVIIHRTLIYSALTITLGAIYFISVLLLQGAFHAFTGQLQPPLATVLSTLMIAALFVPLRRRIQGDIDRRFYRRKYDAEKMLNAFSLTVRNEVELEQLTVRLLDVVEITMEPQCFSLWICKD
jgi:hypothetical protein